MNYDVGSIVIVTRAWGISTNYEMIQNKVLLVLCVEKHDSLACVLICFEGKFGCWLDEIRWLC